MVVIVSQEHKAVGSTGGHTLASTSSLQTARLAGAEHRLKLCREALLARDLSVMGAMIEEDAVIMHAVMMSSHPPLYYWNGATMAVIQAVQQWRADEGLPAGAEHRLKLCREALLARDLSVMGAMIEEDAVIMHAVMMSSHPPLYYWNGATMAVIQAVQQWRADEGLPVYFTIDAGPNVHLICEAAYVEAVEAKARQISGVEKLLTSSPGGAARLVG